MYEVSGITLHKGQRRVVDTILNSDAKYITVVSPRQQGKSTLLVNLLLYFGINDKDNPVIGVVTPVYAQAKKIMEDLVNAISESGIIESKNFSDFNIKLKTGATIIFKSSERGDSIRGNTFDYLFLDETAYQSEDVWKAVIRPTALVKGKKVILFSTPRGHDWFYEMFKMGEDTNFPNYASVRMYQGENTLIDPEEIEDAKRALPDAIYRAEYLGEFIQGESMVFSTFKECIGTKPKKGQIYCGLDLAKQNDYTVATFMDEKGTVIEIFKINLTSWENIIKILVGKFRTYNAKVLVEVNSIGDVIYELIKKQWNNTTPFYTTNESKKDIIEHLILSFNNKTILIPDDKELKHELEVFELSYNPKTRSVKYAARPPFHDDMVISLALANYHKETGKSKGVYAVSTIKR